MKKGALGLILFALPIIAIAMSLTGCVSMKPNLIYDETNNQN